MDEADADADFDNSDVPLDKETARRAVIRAKMIDVLTPGFAASFDPEEAWQAGAFVEDALSEEAALDGVLDLLDGSTDDEEE